MRTEASPWTSGIFNVPPSACRVPPFSVTSSIRGASECQPPSAPAPSGRITARVFQGLPSVSALTWKNTEVSAKLSGVHCQKKPASPAPGVA